MIDYVLPPNDWKCSHTNSRGVSCTNQAAHRIHFSSEHPFDHIDLCLTHISEYSGFCWTQNLLPN